MSLFANNLKAPFLNLLLQLKSASKTQKFN